MKKKFVWLMTFCLVILPSLGLSQKGSFPEIKQLQSPQKPRLGFMIHAGAGVIIKGSLTPEKEKEFQAKLQEVVMAGYKALQAGRSSVDAVEIAIRLMEDSPLFNAGKGAAFNADGKNELDASIMNGKTFASGGVAGLHHVKNPITLARALMEKSPDGLMFGDGAERFAKEQKVELVEEKYFWTQERWDELQKAKAATPQAQDHGSVGAVALDKNGNLAAGTSTGGVTNKKSGRVGDAAIIGAGTYANNDACAVSGTGGDEFFIRLGAARDISAMMEYQALTVQTAADREIHQKLQDLGGDGGVIVMDKFGNMAISFNTEGMYRAYINSDGKPVVEIYKV